mgnify:CR=1 FL=1
MILICQVQPKPIAPPAGAPAGSSARVVACQIRYGLILLLLAAISCTQIKAGPVVGLYFVEGEDEVIDFLNVAPIAPTTEFIKPWEMTASTTQFVTDGAFDGVSEANARAAIIDAVKRKFYSIPTPVNQVLDIEFRAEKVSGPGTVNVLLGQHNQSDRPDRQWFGYSQEGGGLGAEADGSSNAVVLIDRIDSLLQVDFTTFDTAVNAVANVIAHEVGHLLRLEHVWADDRADGWEETDPVVTDPYDVMATAVSGLPESGWIADNIFTTVSGTQAGGLSTVERLIQIVGTRPFELESRFENHGSSLRLSWTSQQGMTYEVKSSTDLAAPFSTWEVFDPDGPGGLPPYTDIQPSGTGLNQLDLPFEDSQRFFYVLEKLE